MTSRVSAGRTRWRNLAGTAAAVGAIAALLAGCARTGRLEYEGYTISPVPEDSAANVAPKGPIRAPLRPLFGDTLIGLMPGTSDSTIRFLGRLRDGYTVDTLNIFICGDNRAGYRLSRISPQLKAIRAGFSLNPIKIARGIVNIPYALARGLYPDLALIREIPSIVRNTPNWSREHEVMRAMLVKIDSLRSRKQTVAAVVSTGDLVEDGRIPMHWERFLRITEPLTKQVPYFPVAGNHERTDTKDGVENWRTATGLPVGSDRLYYCFDSADGWVRFIALDTNPIVNNGSYWTREAQIEYSDEQITWMVARVKEHNGPVLVLMHHPPFSIGSHRMEWQSDSLLIRRREQLVRSLYETGISVLATGHEHSYQRALLTWPDAALLVIVSGGSGAPINPIPPPQQSARLFAQYRVAGSIIKPENVFTSQVFNFTLLRMWFGGGDITTYAVDEKAGVQVIDELKVDLGRYGIPKVDQHKLIIPPATGPQEVEAPEKGMPARPPGEKVDSTATSARLLSQPKPAVKSTLADSAKTKKRVPKRTAPRRR